jgi:hypothetical protein
VRIRSIRPEFWTSEDIARLDWHDRLIFIGLWSYVDDNGVGRDVEPLITAALFPLDDSFSEASLRVHGALKRLHAGGQISRYEVDGKPFLHVSTFSTHQKINRPSGDRYPLPTCGNARLTEPSLSDSLSPHADFPLGEGEKGRRGEVLSPSSADAAEDEPDPFDEFWAAYPRKVEKADARRAWTKALKKTSASEIIDAVQAYPFGDDPKYVKHAATWLNKECWADEPTNVHPIRPGDPHAGMTKWAEVAPGQWQECHPEGFYVGMHTEWRPAR